MNFGDNAATSELMIQGAFASFFVKIPAFFRKTFTFQKKTAFLDHVPLPRLFPLPP